METAKRHQTLLIMWFAMLMNISILFLVALIAAPTTNGSASKVLTLVLAALATFLVVISFAVKRKLFERSVERQDMNLVQKGLILAWAICEVSAMIGLLERFLFGNWDYFVLFLLAAIGIALHFPRRDDLRAANYKTPSAEEIES